MADLPTSHTQLTWLEREEPMSLRLPLASTNTLLLSERKHAKDVAARREDRSLGKYLKENKSKH